MTTEWFEQKLTKETKSARDERAFLFHGDVLMLSATL
jgi:hypothetical protein